MEGGQFGGLEKQKLRCGSGKIDEIESFRREIWGAVIFIMRC